MITYRSLEDLSGEDLKELDSLFSTAREMAFDQSRFYKKRSADAA